MARNYIELPSSGVIDMLEDIPVSLNYSIADIRDPEKRDTSYSKTITIPGTKNNNKLFSHIFEIGASGGFNPNIRTKAIIYEDTIPVFDGYLQLTNITITDQNEIEYEIVIFGKLANIYTVWADDELRNISYSDLSHVYSKANIIASWSATPGTGYVYPMIDYGYTNGTYYNVENFFPALFLKEYIDRIFRYAGFTYTSAFFTSAFFKRLVIPFFGTKLSFTQQQLIDRTFKIRQTADVEYTNQSIINFDTIVTTPNPTSQISLTTDIWTVNDTGTYSVYFEGQTFARVNNSNGGPVNISPNITQNLVVRPWIYLSKAGGQFTFISGGMEDIELVTAGQSSVFPSGDTTILGDVIIDAITLNLVAGDRLKVVLVTGNTLSGYTPPAGITFFGGIKGGAVFYNKPIADITEAGTLDFNSAIPDKIKIRDFFTSIIKAFNLYVEQDKTIPNNLLIEPRNDFYANGTTYDWTSKLDINKPIDIKPMGLLDARDYYFSYKEDGDYWNDLYKRSFGKIYGDKLISSGNQFLTEKKENTLIFSPTPLISFPVSKTASSTRVIPQIVTADTNGNISPKASNIRMLYWGGVRNCNNTWTFKSATGNTAYTTYPYAGHLDDPINPSLDLCFGIPEEIFHIPAIVTNNNLYNVYWKKFINEITDKDSKIVTAYFHLRAIDMLRLDFRNKIFVDGFYYYINKIIDYNPTSDELTKVELIKIKEGVSFLPTTGVVYTTSISFPLGPSELTINQDIGGAYFVPKKKDGNQYNTQSGQVVVGDNNIIDASAINVVVGGSGNVIGAGVNSISLVNSSGNTILPGLTNVHLINTTGVTVSQNNMAYVNGLPILNGSGTVNYYSKFVDVDTLTSGVITDDGTDLKYAHSTKGINKVLADIDGAGTLRFVSAGSYSAGTGLNLSGTQFNLNIPVIASQGGTGQTLYVVGDVLAASGTTSDSLKRIPAMPTGYVFASSGTSTLPGWSQNATLNTSLTTPLILGSSISGGTLTLSSTSNATKGKIVFGTLSAYDEVNDRLGLGTTSPAVMIDVIKSQVASTLIRITNSNAGSGAYVGFQAYNGATYLDIGVVGTGTGSSGEYVIGEPYITTAGTAKNLNISAHGLTDLVFWTNNLSRGRFLSTGELCVGRSTLSGTEIAIFEKIQNSTTSLIVRNSNASANAFAQIQSTNGTSAVILGVNGTGTTGGGVFGTLNQGYVASDNAAGLGVAAYHANGTITFHTGGFAAANLRGTISSAGLFGIGITPSGNGLLQVKAGSQTTIIAKVGGGIYDNFLSSGSVTTGETDIMTNPINANVLATNGDKLEAEYGGLFVSSPTATREIKLYFGGTAIFDTGALTLSLSAAWTMYATIIRVSSTVIRYMISLTTEGAALAAYTAVGELTGLTLSNSNVLKITGQAAGVGAATNDIVLYLGQVKYYSAV